MKDKHKWSTRKYVVDGVVYDNLLELSEHAGIKYPTAYKRMQLWFWNKVLNKCG